MISSLKKSILAFTRLGELLFFPSFCKLCSALLEVPEENVVCHACLERMRTRLPSHCVCCGKFFSGVEESHFCSHCLKVRPPFSIHRSCGRYEGVLKDVILLFKYGRYSLLGKELARFAQAVMKDELELWWKVEALVPVPLHPKRRRERGFNQAQVIARELGRLTGIKLVDDFLVKVKHVLPQTSLEAGERARNVKGAFAVKKGRQAEWETMLLVDDVYTTGATVRECSHVLKRAGVSEVRVLTLARA